MKKKKSKDWLRNGSITFFLLVAVLSFLYGNAGWLFPDEKPAESALSANGTVHYLDCGQGDCAVVVSEGSVVLIDAGPADASAEVIAYLKRLNVEKIDDLILSHPHEDHIGGAEDVLKAFPVGEIYMQRPTQGTEPTTSVYTNLLQEIKAQGKTVHATAPGDTFTAGAFQFTVLGPLQAYPDLNDQSVILRAQDQQTSFLFVGDQEKEAEKDLVLQYGDALSSAVLKVGHHGSSTSSSEDFLKAVSPAYAVISCGVDNPYGHPHQEILDALKQQKISCFRTDKNGSIVFSTDGKTVVAEEVGKSK